MISIVCWLCCSRKGENESNQTVSPVDYKIVDLRQEDGFDIEEAVDAADEDNKTEIKIPELPIRSIIIDCSPINFIDTVGIKSMKQVNKNDLNWNNNRFWNGLFRFKLITDYKEIGIKVYLAESNGIFILYIISDFFIWLKSLSN